MLVKPQRVIVLQVVVPDSLSEKEMYQKASEIDETVRNTFGYESDYTVLTSGRTFKTLLYAAIDIDGEIPRKL